MTCGNFELSFEILPVDDSLTDLVLRLDTNSGGTSDISIMLTSANIYTNSTGGIMGEFINDTIVTTISGCEATYTRQ